MSPQRKTAITAIAVAILVIGAVVGGNQVRQASSVEDDASVAVTASDLPVSPAPSGEPAQEPQAVDEAATLPSSAGSDPASNGAEELSAQAHDDAQIAESYQARIDSMFWLGGSWSQLIWSSEWPEGWSPFKSIHITSTDLTTGESNRTTTTTPQMITAPRTRTEVNLQVANPSHVGLVALQASAGERPPVALAPAVVTPFFPESSFNGSSDLRQATNVCLEPQGDLDGYRIGVQTSGLGTRYKSPLYAPPWETVCGQVRGFGVDDPLTLTLETKSDATELVFHSPLNGPMSVTYRVGKNAPRTFGLRIGSTTVLDGTTVAVATTMPANVVTFRVVPKP